MVTCLPYKSTSLETRSRASHRTCVCHAVGHMLKASATAESANHGSGSLVCDGSSLTPGFLPVDALPPGGAKWNAKVRARPRHPPVPSQPPVFLTMS
ncbi:hypothetical protein SprV_0702407700 [Sparganum proliferum]